MKKIKKFRSLTVTLAIAFLALSAVVLLIANSLQIYFNLKAQRSVIAGRQQLIAQEAANTVRAFIQAKSNFLKTAAGLGNLTASFSPQEQKLVMEKLLGFEPAFRQLVLFNAKEQELLRDSRLSNLLSGQLTEQINQNTNGLFSRITQKNIYISSVYIDKITSEPLIIIAAPIMDVFGDLKGTLLAEVNLKFMWDLVGSIKVGDKGLAYVTDSKGNLIAFGDISRVLKGENLSHLKDPSEFMADNKSPDKTIADMSKGIQSTYVLATYVPLGTPDWAVVIELPVLEAYQSTFASLKLTIWTMLLSFALATIVGGYLSKKITKPIIHLRDAAKRIGEGKLDTRIRLKSKDEINQLAETFNQMTENLQQTTTSIENLNHEITERQKAENDLEDANTELKNFVYIASHDLREPLRKISAFGTMLEKSIKDKITGDDAENLHYMIEGAIRMNKMIEGLLSYSRVSTQTQPFQSVDLNEIIRQFRQLELSMILQEKQVVLDIPQPLPCVQADPVQIRQLMQNLIANGIKYQKKDNLPRITVTSKSASDGMIRIEITDNGIGIAPEYQSAVFTMFKRLHSRSEYEGTGIGLAVCKKIVERHGGQIGIDSEPDKGSTFWFTMPTANIAVAQPAVV